MPGLMRDEHRLSAVSAALVENSGFLKRFLTRFFSNQQDIEDVVQEAYLRAYAAEQKKTIEHPKAFLFRVAKNVALSELSKKSRQITDYIEDLGALAVIDTEASADSEAEAQESLGIYCEAVATLPDKCREVFLLRKVHGLRHKEIAERMSLSISSVEKYLRQGVITCRTFIRDSERCGKIQGTESGVSDSRQKQK
jgi:RNA polymerase sigma-70 factor (ECF subfamily)